MSLTMVEAAYQILKESKIPKHYQEILQDGLQHGLINTQSLTPGSALISAIIRDNSSRIRQGEIARFDPLGDGVYGLVEWRPVGIEQRIADLNKSTRNSLRKKLHEGISPKEFEELVGEILIAIGFVEDSVKVRGRSGDGGIDVTGLLDIEGVSQIEVAVQVKRIKNNVPAEKITALRGSLTPNQRGWFITTSDFTKQARHEADALGKSPISLINGEQILDLMLKYKIGVLTQEHTIYEIDPNYWSEAPVPANTPIHPIPSTNTKIVFQYPLPIFAMYRATRYEAQLQSTGQVIIGDQTYNSVSAAGSAVTNWKSCNGWTFWFFTNPQDNKAYPLSVLRDK